MAQKKQTTNSQSRYSAIFWDIYAWAYDKLLHIRPYQNYLADIVTLLDPNAKLTVELGCGTGNVWLWANRILQLPKDFNVTLMDRSGQMLEKAKKKLQKTSFPITFKEGNISGILPFEDASVEQVVLANALYTSEYPEKILTEIYRILKPNGKLIISDPAPTFSISRIFQAHLQKQTDNKYHITNNRFFPNLKVLLKGACIDRDLFRNLLPMIFILYLNTKLLKKQLNFLTSEKLQTLLFQAGFVIIKTQSSYADQNNLILAERLNRVQEVSL